MKFGAHMPTSGGVWKALQRGASLSCEIVQLFVKNNLQWAGKPFPPDTLALFARELAAAKVVAVFGHTGYLINLGGPPGPNRDKSIQSLIQEIQFAAGLGLPFLVLYPGAHLGAGEAEGIRRIAAGLREIFDATHRTSNFERPTPHPPPVGFDGCWRFDVRCWMFCIFPVIPGPICCRTQ